MNEERGVRRVLAVCVSLVILVMSAGCRENAGSLDYDRLRARAQDRSAQSDLRNALVTAKSYFTEGATYSGFDPATASSIEPLLPWRGNEPASPRAVSINRADGPLVIISTLSDSGNAFCIADDSSVVTYGRRDALGAESLSDCGDDTSGW